MAEFLALITVLLTYWFFLAIGFGSILAPIISWNRNASIVWALVHSWLGWFYVLYYHFFLRKKSSITPESLQKPN